MRAQIAKRTRDGLTPERAIVAAAAPRATRQTRLRASAGERQAVELALAEVGSRMHLNDSDDEQVDHETPEQPPLVCITLLRRVRAETHVYT